MSLTQTRRWFLGALGSFVAAATKRSLPHESIPALFDGILTTVVEKSSKPLSYNWIATGIDQFGNYVEEVIPADKFFEGKGTKEFRVVTAVKLVEGDRVLYYEKTHDEEGQETYYGRSEAVGHLREEICYTDQGLERGTDLRSVGSRDDRFDSNRNYEPSIWPWRERRRDP